MLQMIQCDTAPSANGHYSQAIVANGFVFLSGQLPIVPNSTTDKSAEPKIPHTVEEQAVQVLANIAAILAAAGTAPNRLVSVTIFVTDITYWPIVDRAYSEWMGKHRPARAIFVSPQLHLGASVAMQAIALAGA